ERVGIVKEVLREVARRAGYPPSFPPRPFAGRPGNGAHIHFSPQPADGKPVTHDPTGPGGLGAQAQRFAAGIVRHLPALCALTASSVPSYYRLGPHHWSAGYACLGGSNPEAALRICLPPNAGPAATRPPSHLQLRRAGGTASPYLALGALIRAGLAGIVDELPPSPLVQEDPHDMGPARRGELGIVALPSTLGAALDCLERDTVVRGWF